MSEKNFKTSNCPECGKFRKYSVRRIRIKKGERIIDTYSCKCGKIDEVIFYSMESWLSDSSDRN